MMVLKGCKECGCQLEAAPVGMSARRSTASVSMNPRFWHCAGKDLLSYNQLAKRALFGRGSFCVQIKIDDILFLKILK